MYRKPLNAARLTLRAELWLGIHVPGVHPAGVSFDQYRYWKPPEQLHAPQRSDLTMYVVPFSVASSPPRYASWSRPGVVVGDGDQFDTRSDLGA